MITSQAITELPSALRSVANLLTLEPGVTSFGGYDDRNGSINGGRSDQSNYTLDGADVEPAEQPCCVHHGSARDARLGGRIPHHHHQRRRRYGPRLGRDVTLVTKSGTNTFHGALYEYRRGTETAANSFFNNRAGLPIAPLLINQFGAAVGGPIKKNKAFFFCKLRRPPRRQFHQRGAQRSHGDFEAGHRAVPQRRRPAYVSRPDRLKADRPGSESAWIPAVLAVLKQYPGGQRSGARRRAELHRLSVHRAAAQPSRTPTPRSSITRWTTRASIRCSFAATCRTITRRERRSSPALSPIQ